MKTETSMKSMGLWLLMVFYLAALDFLVPCVSTFFFPFWNQSCSSPIGPFLSIR